MLFGSSRVTFLFPFAIFMYKVDFALQMLLCVLMPTASIVIYLDEYTLGRLLIIT